MNDLISRNDVIEPLKKSLRYCKRMKMHGIKIEMLETIIKLVEEIPAVDAVPVVRCCECKRRYDVDECPMCFLVDGEYHEYTNDNGYCDRGERRNGDG